MPFRAGRPGEAEARRVVVREIDHPAPEAVEDLLAVPAHADVEPEGGRDLPAVLQIGHRVVVLHRRDQLADVGALSIVASGVVQ